MKIDKENELVAFNDDVHKYWIKGTDNFCISVTTLIEKYGQEFDSEFWSNAKALEAIIGDEEFGKIKADLYRTKKFKTKYLEIYKIQPEVFLQKKQEILDAWKQKNIEACERGTAIHKTHEELHLNGSTEEIKKLGLGGTFKCLIDNKLKFGDQGVYPELLLHRISEDGKLRIAGQADLVLVDNEDVYILDYKGLWVETPILTSKGYKLLKDINLDDKLFDKDGKLTNIKNISEVHHNPCYKILFKDGVELIADHEHRWEISFWINKNKHKTVVLNTEEIIPYLEKYNKTKDGRYLPKIQIAEYIDAQVDNDIKQEYVKKVHMFKAKYDYRSIKSIQLIETVPTKCLEVDSESHTFLCGENLIVTHNTNKEIKKTSFYNKSKRSYQMMKYPLSNLQDSNYWHYVLQLSTYAWMIQKMDPRFKIKKLALIHYDHDNKQTIYELPYLKTEVERMLTDYKGQIFKEEQYAKIKPIQY